MEYRPLNQDKHEIRLLTIARLEDISRDSTDPIECKLEYVCGRQTASAPGDGDNIDRDSYWGEFVALSYFWGDPNDTREIYVNGHSLFVTKNLAAALQQLRATPVIASDRSEHCIPVWVDALCINQNDLSERNHQVQRMRSIYTKASVVVAWLGLASDESEKAMGFINTIGETFNTTESLSQPVHAEPDDLEYLGDGIARSIHQLFRRPYWQRLWVLQEIAVTRVMVMCGNEWAPWRHFDVAAIRLNLNWAQFASIIRNDVAHNQLSDRSLSVNGIIRMGVCRSEVISQGYLQDIVRVVMTGRKLRSTDPRDKVYGLLGLVNPALRAALAPNYSLNVEDIYLMFAKDVIRTGQSLEILRTVYTNTPSSQLPSLPSWVPRLDVQSRALLIGHAITPSENFNCSRQIEPNFDFGSPRELHIRGILLDTVDGLGAVHDWDRDYYRDSTLFAQIKQCTHGGNAYGNSGSIREALWQTIVRGLTLFKDEIPIDFHTARIPCTLAKLPDPREDLCDDAHYTNKFLFQNAHLSFCGFQLLLLLCAADDSDLMDRRLLDKIVRAIFSVTAGRRLLITRNGYLGLAPVYTRPCDLITIIPGCSVPMVLRRSGEQFTVVGDSYIHGIMNGEAVADTQKAHDRLEPLTLI